MVLLKSYDRLKFASDHTNARSCSKILFPADFNCVSLEPTAAGHEAFTFACGERRVTVDMEFFGGSVRSPPRTFL